MRRSVTRALAIALSACGLFVLPSHATGETDRFERMRSRLTCQRGYESFADLLASEASMDLYHGLAFFGASGLVNVVGESKRRWTHNNDFDTGIRNGLRLDSLRARRAADTANDATLALGVALLPASGIAATMWRTQDCIESWDMATDLIESIGLTFFMTELLKHVTGRDRPFNDRCVGIPPRDADCSTGDRHRSFLGGHASLAAAGAGLSCSWAVERKAWGTTRSAQVVPCALGIATALTTGVLRVAADRHWTSDVLAGFAVGAVIGYFDTWGPLDLLKFRMRDSKGGIAARGVVLPHASEGRVGLRLMLTF